MLQGQLIFETKLKSFPLQSKPLPKTDQDKQQEKGQAEAIKEIVKEDEKSKLKLNELLDRSNKVLGKVTTIFPFVLFPQNVIVDAAKINIVSSTFFFSEHIHSVMIKDVSDVVVETDLFFATLKIIDSGYTENAITISFLPKEKTKELGKIIQGLVVAAKEGVDLSILDQKDLAQKVEQIGKSNQYAAA